MITLKTGDNARFETVRDGLIPCKVVSIDRCVPSNIVLKITRTRAGYHAGDEIVTTARHAIPVKSVWRRRFKTLILPFWTTPDQEAGQ